MSAAGIPREPFGARTMVWVVLAGVLAMAGFFVLSTYAPDFRIGGDDGPSPLSKSAVGFAGLVELLDAGGVSTDMARSQADVIRPGLLIVPLTPATDAEALKRMVEVREFKPTLFVLPKWQTRPMRTHEGWVNVAGTIDAREIDPIVRRIGDTHVGRCGGRRTLAIDQAGFVAPDHLQWLQDPEPFISAGNGRALVGNTDGTQLYTLADPDLLNNAGLADPARAAAALALLRRLDPNGDRVSFDLTLAGGGRSRDLKKLLVEPPFLPFTLTVVLAAALALWQGFVRFGPPRAEGRAIAFGKAALVETTAQLLRRGGRLGGLGGRYAMLLQMRAGTLLGAPPGLSAEALNAWLDARDPGTPNGFTERAAAEAQATNEAEMQASGAALHRWIMERRREEQV